MRKFAQIKFMMYMHSCVNVRTCATATYYFLLQTKATVPVLLTPNLLV